MNIPSGSITLAL